MMRLIGFLIALALCAAAPNWAGAQQFPPFQYALKDDTGDKIANYDLPPQLSERLAKLVGQVPVGNPQGDVTIMQFYDLNCPFCREAAHDIDELVRSDKKLKLIFVPYAILSVPSVQGGMVEIAAAKKLTPEMYLDFHRRIYEYRGTIDGPRVLAAAKDMGLDQLQLAAAANTEATLQVLRDTVDFGNEAKMLATPAYVLGGVVVLGHPGLKPLQTWIAAVRACGKVVC
jgi:protein-disulfide isomerase